jgi:hypothetical protein
MVEYVSDMVLKKLASAGPVLRFDRAIAIYPVTPNALHHHFIN